MIKLEVQKKKTANQASSALAPFTTAWNSSSNLSVTDSVTPDVLNPLPVEQIPLPLSLGLQHVTPRHNGAHPLVRLQNGWGRVTLISGI